MAEVTHKRRAAHQGDAHSTQRRSVVIHSRALDGVNPGLTPRPDTVDSCRCCSGSDVATLKIDKTGESEYQTGGDRHQ